MSILKPGLAERYERVKQSLTDDESRCGRKPASTQSSQLQRRCKESVNLL